MTKIFTYDSPWRRISARLNNMGFSFKAAGMKPIDGNKNAILVNKGQEKLVARQPFRF